jgi:hypothetical protein
MRFRAELSRDAQKQLARFPRDVRERLTRVEGTHAKDRRLVSHHLHEVPGKRGRGNLCHPHQIQGYLPIVHKRFQNLRRFCSDLILLEFRRSI